MPPRALLVVVLVTLVPGQTAVHKNGSIAFARTQVVALEGIAAIDTSGGAKQLLFASNYVDTGVASPDGSRLACIQPVAPSWLLYVVPTDGAPRVRIGPMSSEGGAPSWSPDGSRLAFAGPGGDLEVAAVVGGDIRRLGVSGVRPAWSPRGDWIAFGTPQGTIDLIRPDGSGHTVLATDPNAYAPTWSHDGAWLAFVADNPAALHNETIVVHPDGTGRRIFPEGGNNIATATWSPTADVLALARSDTGALELVSPDGGVLLSPSIAGSDPMVWSPDGDALALRDPDGTVALVDVRTGAIRTTPLNGDATWSPDGLRLAAVSLNGPATLAVAAAAGGPGQVVSRGVFPGSRAQWLPNGRIVFFALDRVRDVIDTEVERGRPHLLLHGPTTFSDKAKRDFGALAWSPDGRRLAFIRNLCCDPQLAVVGATGRKVRVLAIGVDGVPAWSPDGRWIAFGAEGIEIVSSRGGPTRRLTNGADSSAAWSPDGRWVAFLRGHDEPVLCVTGGSGGRVRPISPDYGAPSWSPAGRLAFVTPSGALETIRPDRTGRERVTADPGGLGPPRWSPDGRWILSNSNIPNADLLLVRPDGTGRHDLGYRLEAPTWSPDGRQLLGRRSEGGEDLVAVEVRSGRTRFDAGYVSSWSWQPR